MTHKCRNCGARVDESRELELAGETRVVYECGDVEYFDNGVSQ